jgi:medium-chain acyl-[acyl-carrier-protein] hydrolase
MSVWYRTLAARPDATRRLVIIPHAGGGPTFYRDFVKNLPKDYDAVALQLPGREARWKELPFKRMEPLVESLVRELPPLWDRPITLFGHSLGAIIAYELTRRLPVERLIVAGTRAPHLPRNRAPLHDLSDTALRQELMRLGGTPSTVLNNEELFGLFLPTLRADLAVLETYSHQTDKPIDVPLHVVGGFTDERTPLIDLLPWRELNRGVTAIEARRGGHFFVDSFDSLREQGSEPQIDFHTIRLHRSIEQHSSLRMCLDESEQHRADRFLRPEHRDRFIVCRAALRHLLAEKLRTSPRDVRLSVSPSGKPQLHADHQSDLCFNLSHSDDFAIIAVARGQELGVDVERIRGDVDHAGLAERYFAPAERTDVLAVPEKDRPDRFFAYWTGKEAYSKARGLGLNLPLDEYDIMLDAQGYPNGVRDRTLPADTIPWHVTGLNVADGFAAAIACPMPISRLRLCGNPLDK